MKFKAVIWDVYGTLCQYDLGDIDDAVFKKTRYIPGIKKELKNFKIDADAEKVNEDIISEIKKEHEKKKKKGVKFPEVIIEKIYKKVLGISERRAKQFVLSIEKNTNKTRFYRGAKETLIKIKKLRLKQGIISNSQFYTLVMLKEQLNKNIYSVFDKKLCLYSFKEGFSKPNPKLINKIKKKLGGMRPSEVLYVGNNYEKDIFFAHKAGFKTVLVTKDILGKKKVKPDYIIDELPQVLKILKSE